MVVICKYCNKEYSSYASRSNHIKKFHTTNIEVDQMMSNNFVKNTVNKMSNKSLTCQKCSKEFNNRQARWSHEKKCNIDNNNIILLLKQQLKEKDDKFKEETNNVKKELEIKFNEQLDTMKKQMMTLMNKHTINNIKKDSEVNPVNNQLINIIMDKNKRIDELNTKITNTTEIIPIKNDGIIEPDSLTLNNVVIISRIEDNYINATQLCQAGGKKFNDWFRLDTTKELINELDSEAGIPASQLIDTKKGNSINFQQGSWIHPQLAIQLAQWISPKFALQVSKWILHLFSNGKVEINMKLIKEKENEIRLKDMKIQLLQDQFQKKQQRKEYPEKNVIYILTTEDNKKKRIYIIGKATKLKHRLSNYNKTAEHEVVYYKECKSEEDMNLAELMVLNKLKEYREKANRDRFILPQEKDISFFTSIIDNSINFLISENVYQQKSKLELKQ